MDFIQVATTAPNRDDAERIAAALVERQLAGCVQIVGPIQSVYRWEGKIERAEEWLCLIKSTRDALPVLEAAIRELHPYDCPEVIATPFVGGSDDYLSWLGDQIG